MYIIFCNISINIGMKKRKVLSKKEQKQKQKDINLSNKKKRYRQLFKRWWKYYFYPWNDDFFLKLNKKDIQKVIDYTFFLESYIDTYVERYPCLNTECYKNHLFLYFHPKWEYKYPDKDKTRIKFIKRFDRYVNKLVEDHYYETAIVQCKRLQRSGDLKKKNGFNTTIKEKE